MRAVPDLSGPLISAKLDAKLRTPLLTGAAFFVSEHALPVQNGQREGGKEQQVESQSAQYAQDCPTSSIGSINRRQMRPHFCKGAVQLIGVNAPRQFGMPGQRLGLGKDLRLFANAGRKTPSSTAQALLQ